MEGYCKLHNRRFVHCCVETCLEYRMRIQEEIEPSKFIEKTPGFYEKKKINEKQLDIYVEKVLDGINFYEERKALNNLWKIDFLNFRPQPDMIGWPEKEEGWKTVMMW